MARLPKIATMYVADIDDYALVGYDDRRGQWVLIEGRNAGDIGPDRIPELIHCEWQTSESPTE